MFVQKCILYPRNCKIGCSFIGPCSDRNTLGASRQWDEIVWSISRKDSLWYPPELCPHFSTQTITLSVHIELSLICFIVQQMCFFVQMYPQHILSKCNYFSKLLHLASLYMNDLLQRITYLWKYICNVGNSFLLCYDVKPAGFVKIHWDFDDGMKFKPGWGLHEPVHTKGTADFKLHDVLFWTFPLVGFWMTFVRTVLIGTPAKMSERHITHACIWKNVLENDCGKFGDTKRIGLLWENVFSSHKLSPPPTCLLCPLHLWYFSTWDMDEEPK